MTEFQSPTVLIAELTGGLNEREQLALCSIDLWPRAFAVRYAIVRAQDDDAEDWQPWPPTWSCFDDTGTEYHESGGSLTSTLDRHVRIGDQWFVGAIAPDVTWLEFRIANTDLVLRVQAR